MKKRILLNLLSGLIIIATPILFLSSCSASANKELSVVIKDIPNNIFDEDIDGSNLKTLETVQKLFVIDQEDFKNITINLFNVENVSFGLTNQIVLTANDDYFFQNGEKTLTSKEFIINPRSLEPTIWFSIALNLWKQTPPSDMRAAWKFLLDTAPPQEKNYPLNGTDISNIEGNSYLSSGILPPDTTPPLPPPQPAPTKFIYAFNLKNNMIYEPLPTSPKYADMHEFNKAISKDITFDYHIIKNELEKTNEAEEPKWLFSLPGVKPLDYLFFVI
ncbi:MAG: hypothetical protein ACRC8C_01065 [Mycoplasmoidaceae bacterium]